VATVRIEGAADAAKLTALEATGHLARYRGFRHWEPAALEVDADRSIPVGVDGEALLLEPPLRFRSVPAAVNVRLPLGASGSSPAGRAVGLSAESVVRLVNIVRGRGATVS
jgi:diacylglycerol kinase family enzyme